MLILSGSLGSIEDLKGQKEKIMGTINRAFDNSKKIGMIGGGHSYALGFVAALAAAFSGAGSLLNVPRGSGMKKAVFSTPTHSPYRQGRRTEQERTKRKARRQKRAKRIMRRGYA